MFTDEEFGVLRKYRRGDDLEDQDRQIVERLSLVGLCSIGFTTENGKPRQTAGLTPRGVELFKYEKIQRNWFKRLVHGYLALHQ